MSLCQLNDALTELRYKCIHVRIVCRRKTVLGDDVASHVDNGVCRHVIADVHTHHLGFHSCQIHTFHNIMVQK